MLSPGWVDDALPAEERGMLTVHEHAVAFRHELARRAVEESLPTLGARTRHAQVLAALRAVGADPARLVHHAEGAGDDEALAEVAPEAARSAATSSVWVPETSRTAADLVLRSCGWHGMIRRWR